MLLVTLVGKDWQKSVAAAAAAGADVALLTGNPSESDIKDAIAAAGERPTGLLAPDTNAEQAAALREAGIGFVTLAPESPASALQAEELGFLLHIKDELTDIQLRTVEALPVDALYVDRDVSASTILGQMELQRLSGLARKPLLVVAPPNPQQHDLLSLREAGVALVAVDMAASDGAASVKALRELIDGLPRRGRKRAGDRPDVTLPAVSGGHEHDEEDAEDE